MIVVTLGTIPYPFNRALLWIDKLLKEGLITEPIFIQYGMSDISILASHADITAASTVTSEELLALVDKARLVISHAGQGSTQMLAARGASFILLPRLKRYREHIDDHQLGFAKSVESFGVRYCLSLVELHESLLNPPPPSPRQLFEGPKLSKYLLEHYPATDRTSLNYQQ